MTNICIIPARGGSKRIPKKNIKNFLGKPIISYSIEVAKKSKLFSEIIVSTDDVEIAEISKKLGAKVPFYRSKKNSDDFATTFDVINEVLTKYKEEKKIFNYACCIYPCAPFVSVNKIKKAYEELTQNQFDSVFPIQENSPPTQRALKIYENKIKLVNSKFLNSRSQDLEKTFHDAGMFYWMDISKILIKKSILTDNCGKIIINELESQDIDSETDWRLAELKYQILKE